MCVAARAAAAPKSSPATSTAKSAKPTGAARCAWYGRCCFISGVCIKVVDGFCKVGGAGILDWVDPEYGLRSTAATSRASVACIAKSGVVATWKSALLRFRLNQEEVKLLNDLKVLQVQDGVEHREGVVEGLRLWTLQRDAARQSGVFDNCDPACLAQCMDD